jgi:sugar lactone lactonase YvrE
MKQPEVLAVLEHRCRLGEGPVWDVRNQRILWLDILAGDIHQDHPETGRHRRFNIGEMIGAIALRERGGLVAATKSGFAFIDPEGETVEHIANPEADKPGNRFNDGKCDPEGRFWAGTMSLQDEPGAGALYILLPEGAVEHKLDGISISNGLAWSLDGQTFYYIDTPTFRVVAFDYDAGTGCIERPRTVIHVPRDLGDPDGMTIDTEGMLWIAHWDGWQVTRWDPTTGTLLSRIELPVARVTSCTFGGDRLQDLYITTASAGLSGEQLAAQPLAGSLFVVKDLGFQGLPPAEYAG